MGVLEIIANLVVEIELSVGWHNLCNILPRKQLQN